MRQKYEEKGVLFLAVYITEAHAKDEWPCGETLSFCNQPTSTEERCLLASKYEQKKYISFPVLVDTISNAFENQFASWPFRFFAIKGNKLAFKAKPELHPHYAYDITTIEKWILNNIN